MGCVDMKYDLLYDIKNRNVISAMPAGRKDTRFGVHRAMLEVDCDDLPDIALLSVRNGKVVLDREIPKPVVSDIDKVVAWAKKAGKI